MMTHIYFKLNKTIKLLALMTALILLINSLLSSTNAEILYNKNGIIISDYEINIMKEFYLSQNNTIKINKNNLIRELVLRKRLIDQQSRSMPKVVENLNQKLEVIMANTNIEQNTITKIILLSDLIKEDFLKSRAFKNKDFFIDTLRKKETSIKLSKDENCTNPKEHNLENFSNQKRSFLL